MRKFHLTEKAMEKMQIDSPAKDPAGRSAAGDQADETKLKDQEEKMTGYQCSWRTDIGRIRKTNQDVVIFGHGLAGVADGMGGHNGGEVASNSLKDGLYRELNGKTPDLQALKEAVEKINNELWETQEKDAALTGMGTTLTLLWPDADRVLIAQVGDSRAYLLRDGTLQRRTEDHSIVADMVRRGVLTEEQAACHPLRNYITRAVGTDDTVEVDLYTEGRQKGDRWLVCSDGLYGQMTNDALQEYLSMENLEEAADKLLQTALDNGGKDNISLVLLEDTTGAQNGPSSSETSVTEEALS